VWAFKRLETIGIYNNSIGVLSESLGNLINLKRLYVDMNPIAALPKSIVRLTHLEELGVAKAQVRQGEINRVHASLPQCKVLQ
jgi:Leucine-rich repeat (LRR) protein